MSGKQWNFRRLKVEGLFGARDYDIAFEEVAPTILTGTNGTGKSTLLRLLHAVASADTQTLVNAPVQKLEVHFGELPPFILSRDLGSRGVSISWGDEGDRLRPPQLDEELPAWAVEAIEDYGSYDTGADLVAVIEDAARSLRIPYSEFSAIRKQVANLDDWELKPEVPDWLDELAGLLPALFVSDKRLFAQGARQTRLATRRRSNLAVDLASGAIAERIRRLDSEYARVSQEQDRRFPSDVIRAMSSKRRTGRREVEELLVQVIHLRERLRAVGVLAGEIAHDPELGADSLEHENVLPVIRTFLQATLTKLDVLEDLSRRLEVLKAFLDERFSGKQVGFDRHEGIRFTLETGESIRPADLSSGEQQMLVLAYEVLFRAEFGTLVLIDEPEISLHVLWQDTLVDTLVEMGRPSGLQFVMATHSPALLASHPESERSLDAPPWGD